MPHSDIASAERRRHPRSPVRLHVELLNETGSEVLGEGVTKNVSPGGMLADCRPPDGLRPGQNIHVRFPLLGPRADEAKLPCLVQRIEDDGPLRFAGRFLAEPPAFLLGPELVGVSDALLEIKQRVLEVAGYDVNVLILGESGTGKNVVARLIHRHSRRSSSPFIRVNCPAIPEGLFSSQLFGNVKGAFTGADSARPGLFRIADGGTILLDEISAIPSSLQAKLLEVLESKQFIPVGGDRPVEADVRIIATTNMHHHGDGLVEEVREDLYYRLNEISFELPPLRERPEDIPVLTRHFTHRYCREFGKPVRPPDECVLRAFRRYRWPGNVRELENAVKRGVLTGRFQPGPAQPPRSTIPDGQRERTVRPDVIDYSAPLDSIRRQAERLALLAALRAAGGDTCQAASLLEISPRTCRRKINELLDGNAPTGPSRTPGPPGHSDRPPAEDADHGILAAGKRLPELSIEEVRQQAEARAIREALKASNYDRTRAAARLGVSYRTLLRKMRLHEISA
ncbi:MAG: sigma 54-interacting transcriptional regulator [Candidatus Brocadiia bacterium]